MRLLSKRSVWLVAASLFFAIAVIGDHEIVAQEPEPRDREVQPERLPVEEVLGGKAEQDGEHERRRGTSFEHRCALSGGRGAPSG